MSLLPGPGLVILSFVNSVGGISATGIALFVNNPNIIRVNKDGSGNFTSIVTAMNSITTASQSNTFMIVVKPGIFTEPQIVFKSWVWIEGQKRRMYKLSLQIIPINIPVVGTDNAGISKLTITGGQPELDMLVFYQSSGASFAKGFYVYDVRYGNNYILSLCDTTNGYTVLFSQNCKVGQQYTFTYGWICQDGGSGNSGRNVVIETTSTGGIPNPQPTDIFTCNGINCEILAQSFIFYANSTTTGIFMMY